MIEDKPRTFKYRPRCGQVLIIGAKPDGSGGAEVKCKLLNGHVGLHQAGGMIAYNTNMIARKRSYHVIWEDERWIA